MIDLYLDVRRVEMKLHEWLTYDLLSKATMSTCASGVNKSYVIELSAKPSPALGHISPSHVLFNAIHEVHHFGVQPLKPNFLPLF